MTRSLRYRLTDAEKGALLERQALLIDAQAAQIAALLARIDALEAERGKPRKTSRNSHTPPSQDPGGVRSGGGVDKDKPRKPRPSRPGVSRRLAANPDETVVCRAGRCACGADVSGREQTCRMRYDHVDIPPVTPHVTRIELHGGRCACGKRYRAAPPAGMRQRAVQGQLVGGRQRLVAAYTKLEPVGEALNFGGRKRVARKEARLDVNIDRVAEREKVDQIPKFVGDGVGAVFRAAKMGLVKAADARWAVGGGRWAVVTAAQDQVARRAAGLGLGRQPPSEWIAHWA